MTKILITGANSFIGTSFRKFSKFNDVSEISLLGKKPEDIDFKGYDAVLHLAAIVHQSGRIPSDTYFKINRDLVLDVAENARKAGVRQFIFLSSLKVYGSESGQSLRNEDSDCLPDDDYGKSKLEAEKGLRKIEDEDFTVSVIRPPLVYGEGVKANMRSLVNLVRKYPILPLGGIQNRRNYIYIENLISYIDRIIERKASGTFIAKDDGSVSTSDLVCSLSKHMGRKRVLIRLPGILIRLGRKIEPGIFDRLYGSMEFDNTKTKSLLDYSPPYSTDEGIKRWLGNAQH